jgi:hypothetical protein
MGPDAVASAATAAPSTSAAGASSAFAAGALRRRFDVPRLAMRSCLAILPARGSYLRASIRRRASSTTLPTRLRLSALHRSRVSSCVCHHG